MVEVVGSIPIAPTRSLPFAFLRALRAPGPLLARPLPRFAPRASRREGGLRALDANIHCTPPRTLGFPGHQPSPTGTEAARLTGGFRPRLVQHVVPRLGLGGCRCRCRGQITRLPAVSPPVCLTFVSAQVPWEGGNPWADSGKAIGFPIQGLGVYNFSSGFAEAVVFRSRP